MLTKYLIQHLKKKYQTTENPKFRSSLSSAASIVGILSNLCLFLVKFVIGRVANSTSVLADAFNNLSDMISSLISLTGIHLSQKRPDEKHPFGYGRVEYITALLVSFAVLDVGLEFLKESLTKIWHPAVLTLQPVMILLLSLSVLVKIWLFFFYRHIAGKSGSPVLKASSLDSLFDAVTTLITLLSFLIFHIFDKNVDGYTGLIVSLIIFRSGISMIRETSAPLLGQEPNREIQKAIISLVQEDPDILGTHDLVIHNYGPAEQMATIHIELPASLSLTEAHAIADRNEKKVLQELHVLLVIHVDPVDQSDKRTEEIRNHLKKILHILDDQLSFHDLQTVFDKNETLIHFDLVVPYNYREDDENRVIFQISSFMRQLNPNYHCIITVDRGSLPDLSL